MELPEFPQLEAKPFSPDSPPEHKEKLMSRVIQLSDDLFFMKEVPVQSIYQLDVMFDRVRKLTANKKTWYLIVDLSETKQPSAEIRQHIRKIYLELSGLQMVALILGTNYLMRVVAQFVAGRAIRIPYHFVGSFEEALANVQKHRMKFTS